MPPPLRVLVVEDSEDDTLLLVRELRRSGREVVWERVETAEQMKSALGREPWDLVLSDYSMPHFSALAALESLRETGLDLPFLVVSGVAGEETAVEVMRAGAHDFLLKGSLQRLVPAVRRELEQAGQRRARRQAEEQYRLLFESSPHPLWVVDRETLRYLAVNDAAVEHYGYSRDEFLSMNIGQIRPPEDVPKVRQAIPKERAGLEKMGIWRHLKKDGTIIHVEITTHTLTFASRLAWLVLAYDVTDRLRAEEALRKSELQFSLAFRASPIATSIVEVATGNFRDVNDQFVRVLGYSREELIGRTSVEVGIWATPEDRERLWERVRKDGIARDEQVRLRARSGEIRDVLGSMAPVDVGAVACVLTTFDDVTERRRAEEARDRFAAIVEFSDDAIIGKTLDGIVTAWNAGAQRLYGYSAEEAIGRPIGLHVPADRAGEIMGILERIRHGESVDHFETVRLREDGTRIDVSLTVSPIRNSSGEVTGASVIAHDITQRRRAEESIQKLLRAVEQAKNVIFMTDPNGAITYVNPAFEETYGYPKEEALGKTPRILKSGQRDQASYERFWQKLLAGESVREEFVNKTREGQLVTVENWVSPVLDVEGRRIGFIAVQDDVTERKLAEKEMRRSEERFRRLFDSNTIGITVADLSGQILESNDAYLAMVGYTREELLSGGVRWDDMTPAEYRETDQIAVEQLQRTGVAQPYEKLLIRKDGTRVPLLIGIAMLEASERSIIAYTVDLSGRRQLEQQLRQAQKMEAIGQLAGGVAHDFNNLLTAILGYSYLLATDVGEKSPLLESIGEIQKAGERAASLTRQLLAFSRRQVLEPKVLEVNALVSNLEKMLRRLIGEDVELATVLDPAVGRVRADAGQIEQVIMNLAVNSRDAMARGGKLTIETSNVDLDDAYAREHVPVLPGSYVMFAVMDTGTGMSAETKAHIFEPFFTTKGQGKGTGLGLATVYGIVKQSGGYIWVYSEVNRGTTVKVYLPRVDANAEEKVVAAVKPSTRGTETILLVEDDQAVRALTRALLEAKGYKVLEGSGAQEAIAIVSGAEHPIDLLLTDVVMPEMGGWDLSSRLVALRPGIKVLYMSGYTDDAVVRHGLVAEGARFLQKPFTPEVLARKVRDALDREP